MSASASNRPAPAVQADLLLDAEGCVRALRLPRATAAVPAADHGNNEAPRRLLGLPTPALLGQPVTNWLREAADHAPARPAAELLRALSATDGTAHPLRWSVDGRSVPVAAYALRFDLTAVGEDTAPEQTPQYLLRLRTHPDPDGHAPQPITPATDTARALRLAEGALADQRERLGVTLDSITDAVITTDAKGRITYFNPAAERLSGWRGVEAVGQPIEELYRRAGAHARRQISNPVRAVLQTGLRVNPHDNTPLTDPEGNARIIADNAAPINSPRNGRLLGVVLVFHDITDRHRAAEEMQRAGRIESLGLLAGGIAHDFNNLLTSVLGNLSLARAAGTLPGGVEEALERGERACLRARELTGQLLTFARGGDPVRKPTALPELIRQAVRFSLMGSNVRAECNFDPDLALIDADEGQLTQVFHNLALNAVQAMPEGGTLSVHAANVHHPGWTDPPLPAGNYVAVTVRDTGTGINADNLAKIFDPFFTTKASGTGLGLATTYSILRKHLGAIEVSSKVNHGTTFTIHLPASATPAMNHPTPSTGSPGTTADPRPDGPGGRILFMDDDSDIRELAGAILALLGYETTLTSDGAEAIREYTAAREAGQPFAAVILDLTIPGGMGGKEAVKKLREIDPGVRAIVSSGYSNDAVSAEYHAVGFVGMVAKPYRMDDLAKVLREVIAPGGA